jgi:hypothetical protein
VACLTVEIEHVQIANRGRVEGTYGLSGAVTMLSAMCEQPGQPSSQGTPALSGRRCARVEHQVVRELTPFAEQIADFWDSEPRAGQSMRRVVRTRSKLMPAPVFT